MHCSTVILGNNFSVIHCDVFEVAILMTLGGIVLPFVIDYYFIFN